MLNRAFSFAALLSIFCAQRWASSSEPRVQFVNVAREAGITFKHENRASQEKLMPETFGAGGAAISFDKGGFPDLFFPNGGDPAPRKAYPRHGASQKTGQRKFEDV